MALAFLFLLQQSVRHVFFEWKKHQRLLSAYIAWLPTTVHILAMISKLWMILSKILPYQVFPILLFLMFPVLIELDSFGLPVFSIRASPLKLTKTAFRDPCFFFVWSLLFHICSFFPSALFAVWWPHFCCVGLCF